MKTDGKTIVTRAGILGVVVAALALLRGCIGLRASGAVLWCVVGLVGLVGVCETFGQHSPGPIDPDVNGPRRVDQGRHVLVGGTVVVSPGVVVEGGTVVVVDGVITGVVGGGGGGGMGGGRDWAGEGYQVHDAAGLWVYAGLIDAYVEVEVGDEGGGGGVGGVGDGMVRHPNPGVRPERRAVDGGGVSAELASSLRSLGFTAAGVSPRGGIFRGTSAVLSLHGPRVARGEHGPRVYREEAYRAVGFETGGRGGERVPNSQMGLIALLRQSFLDASYQRKAREAGESIAVNALDVLDDRLAYLFDAGDELEVLRGLKVAGEFGLPAMVLGSGFEFRRLDAVVDAVRGAGVGGGDAVVVVPLRYPQTPGVTGVGAIESMGLRDLLTWEQAPTNARRLDDAGVVVCLTSSKLRYGSRDRRGEFHERVRTAIETGGLSAERALAMLTVHPAEALGVGDVMGTVEVGKRANLLVTDGALFERGTRVRDVWVEGVRFEVNRGPGVEIAGSWRAVLSQRFELMLDIERVAAEPGRDARYRATVREVMGDGRVVTQRASSVSYEDGKLDVVFDHRPFMPEGVGEGNPGMGFFTLSGRVVGDGGGVGGGGVVLTGTGLRADGRAFGWRAEREGGDGDVGGGVAGGRLWNGRWDVVVDDRVSLSLDVTGERVVLTSGDRVGRAERVEVVGETIRFVLPEGWVAGVAGEVELKGVLAGGGVVVGSGAAGDGVVLDWRGERVGGARAVDALPRPPEELPGYPFGAYAYSELPSQETVLIRGATVWTSGPLGVIENGDVLVRDGKIAWVGEGGGVAVPTGARVVDGRGKHLTPGLIDAHSHTGISRGVNESGRAVTAEVRIGDVTDPDSVSWYRQLAGGVTVVNSMHGSANPIGGQTQTNKIRWGVAHPDEMHMEDAKPGIKFALGENVVQVNWSRASDRYPKTRMGVEALIRDRFNEAREYEARMMRRDGGPVRRDLELDALAEILRGERLVHCHSYRQDEILMLCNLATSFGFRIGTFQHVNEGFKVASEIREASIGASSFSDWWAYKVEVQDSTPYNGAIMWSAGVVVSFNSDSDELARRMNTEAAKAVRYGGISKEEALKFVTINPAIQLGIADRVGSIEVGKDADLALWSGDPLSVYSMCERTWVDGREMFSVERDVELRKANAEARRRVVQKMMQAASLKAGTPESKVEGGVAAGGAGDGESEPEVGGRARRRGVAVIVAEAAAVARRDHFLDLWRHGIDPAWARCGICGLEGH